MFNFYIHYVEINSSRAIMNFSVRKKISPIGFTGKNFISNAQLG